MNDPSPILLEHPPGEACEKGIQDRNAYGWERLWVREGRRRLHYLSLVIALPLPLLRPPVLSALLSWFTELLEHIRTKCMSTLWNPQPYTVVQTYFPCHSCCASSVYSHSVVLALVRYRDSLFFPAWTVWAVLGFCPVMVGIELWWRRGTGPLPRLLYPPN